MSTANRPPFAPLRRVITGHSTDGKSVIIEDAAVEPHPFGHKQETFFTDLYWTDEFPADNGLEFKDLAKDHTNDIFSQNGSSVKLTEFPPGGSSVRVSSSIIVKRELTSDMHQPYHRTVTLDYAIILHGSITVILDDNKCVLLNTGDVLVQRGTIHSWLNEGTEWCRMLAIMLRK